MRWSIGFIHFDPSHVDRKRGMSALSRKLSPGFMDFRNSDTTNACTIQERTSLDTSYLSCHNGSLSSTVLEMDSPGLAKLSRRSTMNLVIVTQESENVCLEDTSGDSSKEIVQTVRLSVH